MPKTRARVEFERIRKTGRKAEAARLETDTLVTKVQAGWLTNDEAAQQSVGHDAVAPLPHTNATHTPANLPRSTRFDNKTAIVYNSGKGKPCDRSTHRLRPDLRQPRARRGW